MTAALVLALGLLTVSGFQSADGNLVIEFIRNPRWSSRGNDVAAAAAKPAVKSLPPPPPISDAARYARYIVHYSEWTSVGHISHQQATDWFPSSRVFSMADGPVDNSTGVPYIYTSLYDPAARDLKKDPRCSMTMSLAQTEFCSSRSLDPEDPRCPQVILTGYFVIIENNTEEWNFAANALFTRHPEMKSWPKGHHFFFAKLDIRHVQIVNNIGGSKYPSVKDYFNSPPPMKSSRVVRPAIDSQIVEDLEEVIGDGFNANEIDDFEVNMMN